MANYDKTICFYQKKIHPPASDKNRIYFKKWPVYKDLSRPYIKTGASLKAGAR